ncbi:2-phospho-L-lactate guanylyltransferase [Yinghuangia soli]|uniref:Phosphoenolpyruvate guanylyltransferase n=1 Tax=Yinghuangia soli TaxID=2908204 RepID=A0AA41PZS2_9ACTN|nr:2-phospho-L-lactate guanylyltransferase [Yinghuangia soli]MCF2528592.1 2-phospho-L-lactate guanylyltransferase [Yinghuangia soli]
MREPRVIPGLAARPGLPVVPPAARRWQLVVPVKPLPLAKSRLAPATGEHRGELALAFAVDTVSAALACSRVDGVLVVTDDAAVRAAVRAAGAETVGDVGGGLNRALEHGAVHAARRRPGAGIAALSADLPALRPEELDRVLAEAGAHRRAFLADAAGIGTTLLAAAPGIALAPGFGGASRARHRASGAYELGPADVDSVRRDVDTGADLARAVELGVGPRTWAVLPLLTAGC